MSVPRDFPPQELIGHFLWKKRKAGQKLDTLLSEAWPLLTPDMLLKRPVWFSPNLVYLSQLQKLG